MAQVKISQLLDAPTPNTSTVIPCVSGGTTRKLSLSTLKNFLEIPTEFVTLVIAESPITVSPSDGIRGEGSVGILESTPTGRGTMSALHHSMLADATSLPVESKLVTRNNQGSFEARDIILRAPGVAATAATGTLTGNVNQRLSTDNGVNAALGKVTPYTAAVTTLNASGAATFTSSADFTNGPVRIGNTPVKVTINGDGSSSFSGDMSVGGNVVLASGKRFEGAVNTGATAFSGKFSDLTVNSGLTASGSAHSITGPVSLNGNLTFDSNRTLGLPGGSASLTVGNTSISSSGINSSTFTGNLTGNCSGSATSLANARWITLAGGVTGSAQFNGSSDITINTTISGGLSGSSLSAGSVTDDKLATITTAGKVSADAVRATAESIENRIVLRDSQKGFSAGTITASLNGNASSASSLSSAGLGANYAWTGDHSWSMTGVGSNGEAGAQSKFVFLNDSSGGEAWVTFKASGTYWNLGGEAGQFYLSQGGSAKVFVDTSGDMTVANNITAFSDERLKENWKPPTTLIVARTIAIKPKITDKLQF